MLTRTTLGAALIHTQPKYMCVIISYRPHRRASRRRTATRPIRCAPGRGGAFISGLASITGVDSSSRRRQACSTTTLPSSPRSRHLQGSGWFGEGFRSLPRHVFLTRSTPVKLSSTVLLPVPFCHFAAVAQCRCHCCCRCCCCCCRCCWLLQDHWIISGVYTLTHSQAYLVWTPAAHMHMHSNPHADTYILWYIVVYLVIMYTANNV